jgi:hypothetical protein
MPSRGWLPEPGLAVELLRLVDAMGRMVGDGRGPRGAWPAAIDPFAPDQAEVRRLLGMIAYDLVQDQAEQPSARTHSTSREVVERFRLTPAELDVLLLALFVEIDVRFCRVIALLNDHAARTRPTLGLAASLTAFSSRTHLLPIDLLQGTLVRDGLLATEGEGPLPEIAIRIQRDALYRLLAPMSDAEEFAGTPVAVRRPPSADAVAIEAGVRDRLLAWQASFIRGEAPPLIVTGERGAGRRSAAHAIGLAGSALISIDVDSHTLRARECGSRPIMTSCAA